MERVLHVFVQVPVPAEPAPGVWPDPGRARPSYRALPSGTRYITRRYSWQSADLTQRPVDLQNNDPLYTITNDQLIQQNDQQIHCSDQLIPDGYQQILQF
jgi:hypothetical protein